MLLWNQFNKEPVVIAEAPTKVIKLDLYTHTWRDDPPELNAGQIKTKLAASGYKVVTKKSKKSDLTLKIEYEEEMGYKIEPYGMGTNVNFAFWLSEPDGTEIFSDRTLIRHPEKSKRPTEETLAKFESSSFYAVFGEYIHAVLEDDIAPLTTLMESKTLWPLSNSRVAAAEALCGIGSDKARAALKKQLEEEDEGPVAEVIKVGLGLEYQ